jgi:hypothetical protein
MTRRAALGSAMFTAFGASAREQDMTHILLLGDSVFDNAAYVGGGPDVLAQLRAELPAGWRASSLARDGAVAADVAGQLAHVPSGATHLVVSAGGNDALGFSPVLGAPARSVAAAVAMLAEAQAAFQASYAALLDRAAAAPGRLALCTIYDPRYPDPVERRVATTALAVINDVILREAARRGLAVIDLRLVCDEDADFANPIEPSVRGGAKIARAILGFAGAGPGDGRAELFTR